LGRVDTFASRGTSGADPIFSQGVTMTEQALQEKTALTRLHEKTAPIRDQIRAVAFGQSKGYYLFGKPGTGKTFVVRETLRNSGCKFYVHQGHVTARALFDIFMMHFDEVIVLDDVTAVFKDTIAVQLLLAACGTQDGSRTRLIQWAKNTGSLQVPFQGGVIAISNLEIANDLVSQALASRVPYNDYNLTNEDIALIIRSIAARGVAGLDRRICQEIAEFVIVESAERQMRLDLRLYADKAIPQYLLWQLDETETHWKDLVRSMMNVQLIPPVSTVRLGPTSREQKVRERVIASEIRAHGGGRAVETTAWRTATGRSPATYYRVLKELDVEDVATA